MKVTDSLIKRRVLFVLLGTCGVFGLLIGRVVHITTIDTKFYQQKAEQTITRSIPVYALRGEFLDASGAPLVKTVSASTVIAVPSQIRDPKTTAEKLAKVLNGSEQRIERLLKKKTLMVYLRPYGRRIDEAKTRAIRQLRLSGIYLTEESKRSYPLGSLSASVFGVTGGEGQGLSGLELYYNQELEGKKGAIR